MDRELELWREHYFRRRMRHLFLEYPYYTAQFLNLWMQSDNDDILYQVYNDAIGTPGNVPYWLVFFKTIKTEMPETVFHGTDVGHQYESTGARYLQYLRDAGLTDSEAYGLAEASVRQGEIFYENHDLDAYRESKMIENFIREFDSLDGESIMGVYGNAHICIGDIEENGVVTPTMAKGLQPRYGDAVHTEDLSHLALHTEPMHTEKITVGGKAYDGAYFGEEDMRTWSEKYVCRRFWRLENAGDDFADAALDPSQNVLPFDNYPVKVEVGQVFVIDYTAPDGAIERQYLRADGNYWRGMPITQQILLTKC
jgi:hypothetical protein